jgi:hypothetical protein
MNSASVDGLVVRPLGQSKWSLNLGKRIATMTRMTIRDLTYTTPPLLDRTACRDLAQSEQKRKSARVLAVLVEFLRFK